MDHDQLDEALRRTFDDRRLSRGERRAFGELLADVAGDEDRLRYVRNRAFDIAREQIRDEPAREALDWLADVVRLVDKQREPGRPGHATAHFSPGHECRRQVIALARSARRGIDACVYTITDNRIREALMAAHDRGVAVRIITDDEKIHDLGSDILALRDHGIPVAVDDSPDFMHHKFAVFDREQLLNGSFNWTRGASERNHENVIVTDDARLVARFVDTFEELWGSLPRL